MPQSYDTDENLGTPNYAAGEDEQERRRRFELLKKKVGNERAAEFMNKFSGMDSSQFDAAMGQSSGTPQPQQAAQQPQPSPKGKGYNGAALIEEPQQSASARDQKNQGRQWGSQSPVSDQGSLYDEGTTRHREIQQQDDPEGSRSVFGTGWNMQGRRTKLTKDEIQLELRQLSGEADNFSAMRQQLTQNFERMDPVARTHYNQMQKQAMALEKARSEGRLRPLEYYRGIAGLSERAKQIKWQYHFKAPGGEPGDIVVTDGIRKIRKRDGELEAVGYTPQFIQENLVHLPNGKTMVPTSPGHPYEIMDSEKWDASSIEGQKNEYKKLHKEQWAHSYKTYIETTGRPPSTSEELRELEDSTNSQVLSIMDSQNRGIEQLEARQRARSSAAANGQPLQQNDIMQEQAAREQATTKQQLQGKMKEHVDQARSQAQNAQQTQQGPETEKAIAANWHKDPQVMQAASNPITVRTEQDIKQVPDGKVIMTAKGQRYIKVKGKLYAIDWDGIMGSREQPQK